MSLIILLILSEEETFNKNVHNMVSYCQNETAILKDVNLLKKIYEVTVNYK